MAKSSNKRKQAQGGGGSLYKTLYATAMATVAGVIPDTGMPLNKLMHVAGIAVAQKRGGTEHELPNKQSEVVAAVMTAMGADPNEVAQALTEMLPADMIASVEGVSVETVQENRAQVKAARKAHGVFSAEAKEARQDLRADRKTMRQDRRARRREAGGGSGFVDTAANVLAFLK
jgi:hypothetical protein